MKTSRPARRTLLSVLFAAVVLSGCVVAARAPANAVVYVDRPPPAAYNEVITVSPGPGHVWVGGYWNWTGRDYAWVRGNWVRPAHGHSHWVPGHWKNDGRGHYWTPGHWR